MKKKDLLILVIAIVTILAVQAVTHLMETLFRACHTEFQPYWYNKEEIITAVIIVAAVMIIDVFLVLKSDIGFKPGKIFLIADLIAVCYGLFIEALGYLSFVFYDSVIASVLDFIAMILMGYHDFIGLLYVFVGPPFFLTSSILGTAIAFKHRKNISKPYIWILLGIIEIGYFVWMTYTSGIRDL